MVEVVETVVEVVEVAAMDIAAAITLVNPARKVSGALT